MRGWPPRRPPGLSSVHGALRDMQCGEQVWNREESVEAEKAPSGALQSCQTPGAFPSAHSVSLEVKRWAGLSGPVAVSLFISPGQKEGERVSSPVCLQGGHGGQMWEGTGGSFLLPPQRLVVQTGMIEPTFDNSFGPCPQGLWDR